MSGPVIYVVPLEKVEQTVLTALVDGLKKVFSHTVKSKEGIKIPPKSLPNWEGEKSQQDRIKF